MEDMKNILLQEVADAELVLVGIGEEFEKTAEGLTEIPEFADAVRKIEEKDTLHWLMPYLEKIYLDKNREKKIEEAYTVLENILKDKNYFIISTCIDDYIYNTNLKKEKIVTPCGNYRKLQCGKGCNHELYEIDKQLLEEMEVCLMNGDGLDRLAAKRCPKCGENLVFNNIKAEKYVEEGYLEHWNNYTRWIQGTINRKLCVLELGVGMRYPSVIRWPFEKVVYFNQKSRMFRIHSKLYQLTEEIKDRGYKVEEKPVNFLINRFV